jgi:hypothetical protein
VAEQAGSEQFGGDSGGRLGEGGGHGSGMLSRERWFDAQSVTPSCELKELFGLGLRPPPSSARRAPARLRPVMETA